MDRKKLIYCWIIPGLLTLIIGLQFFSIKIFEDIFSLWWEKVIVLSLIFLGLYELFIIFLKINRKKIILHMIFPIILTIIVSIWLFTLKEPIWLKDDWQWIRFLFIVLTFLITNSLIYSIEYSIEIYRDNKQIAKDISDKYKKSKK